MQPGSFWLGIVLAIEFLLCNLDMFNTSVCLKLSVILLSFTHAMFEWSWQLPFNFIFSFVNLLKIETGRDPSSHVQSSYCSQPSWVFYHETTGMLILLILLWNCPLVSRLNLNFPPFQYMGSFRFHKEYDLKVLIVDIAMWLTDHIHHCNLGFYVLILSLHSIGCVLGSMMFSICSHVAISVSYGHLNYSVGCLGVLPSFSWPSWTF